MKQAGAILDALAHGATAPDALAELAQGTVVNTRQLTAARRGSFAAHPRFVLARQLRHLDFLSDDLA